MQKLSSLRNIRITRVYFCRKFKFAVFCCYRASFFTRQKKAMIVGRSLLGPDGTQYFALNFVLSIQIRFVADDDMSCVNDSYCFIRKNIFQQDIIFFIARLRVILNLNCSRLQHTEPFVYVLYIYVSSGRSCWIERGKTMISMEKIKIKSIRNDDIIIQNKDNGIYCKL